MIMREIPGFNGKYLAADNGQIWNVREKRFMSQNDNGNGYLYVRLSRNGKVLNYRVNRLVCLAFWGEAPEGKNIVAHKDDNRLNNNYENLYWTT